jgi:hypothetical protein
MEESVRRRSIRGDGNEKIYVGKQCCGAGPFLCGSSSGSGLAGRRKNSLGAEGITTGMEERKQLRRRRSSSGGGNSQKI